MTTTPSKIQQMAILRAAGWTIAAISEQSGMSISTVVRVLKRHSVKAGEAQAAMVQLARQELQTRFNNDETVQALFNSLIADTVAHISLARQKAAQALEHLTPEDTASAALTLRGLAAHAVLTKTHTDTVRSLVPRPIDQQQLPELVIRAMTREDVEQLRREQKEEMEEIGCGYDQEGEDGEIVEESMD